MIKMCIQTQNFKKVGQLFKLLQRSFNPGLKIYRFLKFSKREISNFPDFTREEF